MHLGFSVFGPVARLDDVTPANMALQLHIYVSLETDLLTARGVAHLVVHRTSGSTSYETIPHVRLETSGDVQSTVDMVVQRRDGRRWLRELDDVMTLMIHKTRSRRQAGRKMPRHGIDGRMHALTHRLYAKTITRKHNASDPIYMIDRAGFTPSGAAVQKKCGAPNI